MAFTLMVALLAWLLGAHEAEGQMRGRGGCRVPFWSRPAILSPRRSRFCASSRNRLPSHAMDFRTVGFCPSRVCVDSARANFHNSLCALFL